MGKARVRIFTAGFFCILPFIVAGGRLNGKIEWLDKKAIDISS